MNKFSVGDVVRHKFGQVEGVVWGSIPPSRTRVFVDWGFGADEDGPPILAEDLVLVRSAPWVCDYSKAFALVKQRVWVCALEKTSAWVTRYAQKTMLEDSGWFEKTKEIDKLIAHFEGRERYSQSPLLEMYDGIGKLERHVFLHRVKELEGGVWRSKLPKSMRPWHKRLLNWIRYGARGYPKEFPAALAAHTAMREAVKTPLPEAKWRPATAAELCGLHNDGITDTVKWKTVTRDGVVTRNPDG